jgi:hypothetical protein
MIHGIYFYIHYNIDTKAEISYNKFNFEEYWEYILKIYLSFSNIAFEIMKDIDPSIL